jgi:hypothetical protein
MDRKLGRKRRTRDKEKTKGALKTKRKKKV